MKAFPCLNRKVYPANWYLSKIIDTDAETLTFRRPSNTNAYTGL